MESLLSSIFWISAREVWGIVGQDPSDSKSNWLHVDIFQFCFHSFEVYSSIDSSKVIGNSAEVSNFNLLFLNSIGSSVSNRRFSPSPDQVLDNHQQLVTDEPVGFEI